ncbi:MAG TPA: hemolysin III family protein [Candidatus Binatia bacterium]|nr:hemolysin III family protein [Candidatus Binatia bacterium]
MKSRPRLRGVLHQYAFFASLPALPALLLVSRTGRATAAGAVYGCSLVALFGVSALFHRVTWSGPARRWMGRLDHAMINVLIAGTYTPLGLLVLSGPVAATTLGLIWGGALASTLLHVLWIDAPKWLSTVMYLALGWSGIAAMPQLVSQVGWAPTALLALGGALYSAGAAVYALRRPDPVPAVFGYHEMFHALVIAAAVTHYAVVAVYILPRV